MKGLDRRVVGSIASGLHGVAAFFVVDGLTPKTAYAESAGKPRKCCNAGSRSAYAHPHSSISSCPPLVKCISAVAGGVKASNSKKYFGSFE